MRIKMKIFKNILLLEEVNLKVVETLLNIQLKYKMSC